MVVRFIGLRLTGKANLFEKNGNSKGENMTTKDIVEHMDSFLVGDTTGLELGQWASKQLKALTIAGAWWNPSNWLVCDALSALTLADEVVEYNPSSEVEYHESEYRKAIERFRQALRGEMVYHTSGYLKLVPIGHERRALSSHLSSLFEWVEGMLSRFEKEGMVLDVVLSLDPFEIEAQRKSLSVTTLDEILMNEMLFTLELLGRSAYVQEGEGWRQIEVDIGENEPKENEIERLTLLAECFRGELPFRLTARFDGANRCVIVLTVVDD